MRTVGIIGAGPAGLTAAIELLKNPGYAPIIFEQSGDFGGISRTVNYCGNRMDIGGHRFFSKSERVMEAWQEILPLEREGYKADSEDKVMLTRNRLSRILFLKQFFDYPLSLKVDTLRKLGIGRTCKIGVSYVSSQLFPVHPEVTLEDFYINRFGRELYSTFFEDYTEKVWGVPCGSIPRDWGAQRVKGLSISKVVWQAVKKQFQSSQDINQKAVETSLIERFLYPKHGPGQLWEEVAALVQKRGGKILRYHKVTGIECDGKRVSRIVARNENTGEIATYEVDDCISSMPVKELVNSMTGKEIPSQVSAVANGLMYRDFVTIGVIIPRNHCQELADNWIYVQDRDVRMGRIQVFNNWSPYLVANPETIWLGLEYFCQEGDNFWSMSDKDLSQLAIRELAQIGIIDDLQDVLDTNVIRVEKAYPAYFGTYKQFDTIREYTDQITNLYLVGRNGMHCYNNMDHSMLTAMLAVENIMQGIPIKDNIWSVNSEEEYHEEK